MEKKKTHKYIHGVYLYIELSSGQADSATISLGALKTQRIAIFKLLRGLVFSDIWHVNVTKGTGWAGGGERGRGSGLYKNKHLSKVNLPH